ncbi:MAG: hypothetical protein E5X58_29995 [Mesorhizobium sp.]|nr:MAG: hypothetical protein E5X58_29995 [Mesorhizobium sp.]
MQFLYRRHLAARCSKGITMPLQSSPFPGDVGIAIVAQHSRQRFRRRRQEPLHSVETFRDLQSEATEWRRYLHQNPELGMEYTTQLSWPRN